MLQLLWNRVRAAAAAGLALLLATQASAGPAPLQYPAPRLPELPAVVSQDDLLQAARVFVKRKSGGGLPGYDIKQSEKVLLLVTALYDRRIIAALVQAIHEAGASADVFEGDTADIIGTSLGVRDWGYLENPMYLFLGSVQQYLMRLELGGGLMPQTVPQLVAVRKYDLLIGGSSSTQSGLPYRWEELPWHSPDELLASAKVAYPRELGGQVYNLAWQQLRQARKVHVTDPEGTDITWKLPGYIAQIDTPRFWREYMCMPERLKGNGLESAQSMRDVDVNGVVAGTINHVGAFPQIKIYIRHSHIEKVEGGGRFGDEFRKVLQQYASTRWPGDQPNPGFGWIEECAIGVIPSEGRPRDAMTFPLGTFRERRRSGVFHWAFGAQTSPEVAAQLEAQGLPDGHFDVHNNFGTMVLETAAGKKIVFVDKGHMTVLDDPQVHELAAKYGDPDVVLREQWIPPVPGINVPGDYLKDYASNPVPWIQSEYERFAVGRSGGKP